MQDTVPRLQRRARKPPSLLLAESVKAGCADPMAQPIDRNYLSSVEQPTTRTEADGPPAYS